jgi:hypothetical protein
MKTRSLLSISLAAFLSITPQVMAQSSTATVLCLNRSTQELKIRTSCLSNETLVSGKNLVTAVATAKPDTTVTAKYTLNLDTCYKTTAKKSGSTFDGRVSVGLLCKLKTDLLLNDQFTTTDSTNSKPVLERRRLSMSGNLPNGVEYGLIASGGNNKFYEVQVAAVCCPTVTSK